MSLWLHSPSTFNIVFLHALRYYLTGNAGGSSMKLRGVHEMHELVQFSGPKWRGRAALCGNGCLVGCKVQHQHSAAGHLLPSSRE